MIKRAGFQLALLGLAAGGLIGCGAGDGTPQGAVVGRAGLYDYSPSVMQTGDERQFWWCGNAQNSTDPTQTSDAILYESINQKTGRKVGPVVALAETASAWDSAFTCNPKVVQGKFVNPLGNGMNYTYAMYYVGTSQTDGVSNAIGVAFSNDGIAWAKYSEPVILSQSPSIGYGAGQPAPHNENGGSAVTLYYEDNLETAVHFKATSTDGIHFLKEGMLTTAGLDPANPNPSWGDLGYDRSGDYWYATFNLGYRSTASTSGVSERAQYGFAVYRIPSASLVNGTTPWQLIKIVDTNLTGNEGNFLAGFLRDGNGNIDIGSFPDLQLYPSISNPAVPWDASPETAAKSGEIGSWDIGSYVWTAGHPLLSLDRYSNSQATITTTGWVESKSGFALKSALGHLYETPQNGADLPFYGCKSGTLSYFLSTDPDCQGQFFLGLDGYGYAQPVSGLNLSPLYGCSSAGAGVGAFAVASQTTACSASEQGGLLGYLLP